MTTPATEATTTAPSESKPPAIPTAAAAAAAPPAVKVIAPDATAPAGAKRAAQTAGPPAAKKANGKIKYNGAGMFKIVFLFRSHACVCLLVH
jgi:hypothetical protein